MANIPPGQQLNDLLVTRNFEPQALDATGKPAPTPAEATTFSFDYMGESGKDYGTVVIMLGEENVMNVFFGDNVGKSMEGDDKKEWFDFLYQLRQFAKRNLLTFSLQNLNKLKYSMQGQAAIKEGIFESWSGNKTNSWNGSETDARLMIKHKKTIKEGDARFRYIETLFIETADGERFKLPFKSLTAGRAMLEHVKQGGRPYDNRGQHIVTMVTEMNLLSRFRRANQGKIFEGETAQLVEQATEHYSNLHHTLKSLSSKTGYKKYFESWNPAEINDEDVIIEDLRHMFVEQNIDSRIEQALPLLARLKQETAMKEINVFEGWMNLLSEGTWALPDTPEKQQKLIALLADELPVGPDATNATELLYDLLGDDQLFDSLGELAQQDANADARTVIIDRLEQMKSNPAVAQVIGKLKIEQTPAAEPQQDLKEFAPGGDSHGDENHLLKLARQWAHAGDDYDTQDRVEADLAKFGYGISEIEDGSEAVQLIPTGEYMIDWNDNDIIVFNPEELTEASDTVKLGPDGKPESWSHEGDWKKTARRNGKPVDPRGEVANMAGQELAKAKKIANLKEDETNPVESAILGRIMNTQTGLLAKYGPQAVMDAVRDEAEWVGDVDEIGSSDVSGWVNNVVRNLEAGQPNQPKLEENDVPARVHKLNLDMLDLLDQAKTASPEAKAELKQQFQAAKKERNELLGGTLADSPKGVLDELSPGTLGSYVKRASSDRAMRNFDQGLDTGTTFQDREPKFDKENSRKDDQRRSGIHKAVNRLTREEEINELGPDTLKSYIKKAANSAVNKGHELGQKQAAADEVDRYTNRHFPKGVDQFDQRERMRSAVGAGGDDINRTRSRAAKRVAGIGRATDRLEEGGMSEADILFQEIARGTVDIYDIYAHPKTNIEKFVSDQIHEKYEEVAREQGYHLDDDFEQILDRIQRELEAEYGVDDNMDIEMETVGGGNFLEEGNMVYDPITKKMVPAKRARVKMGGGWRKTDPATGRVYDSSDPSEIGKHKDELEESDMNLQSKSVKQLKNLIRELQASSMGMKEVMLIQAVKDELANRSVNETTALAGQYGHSGRLQTVKPQDADMMDRIKFLAGIVK
jgi:hypothetical protein